MLLQTASLMLLYELLLLLAALPFWHEKIELRPVGILLTMGVGATLIPSLPSVPPYGYFCLISANTRFTLS